MGKPEAKLFHPRAFAKGTHYHLTYFSFVQKVCLLSFIVQQKDKPSMELQCAEEPQEYPIYSLLMIVWCFAEQL